MSLHSTENIILMTKRIVESDKKSEIRLNANGGNSILIVCDPKHESHFIETMHNLLENDLYRIIDLNELLINYVDINKDSLIEKMDMLRSSVTQVFKSTENIDSSDLFSIVMETITESFKADKIPVLINSGALYGTGIENIHLIENEIVMRSKLPLIVLYPATKDGDNLLFLSKRPASKYRCMVINEDNF